MDTTTIINLLNFTVPSIITGLVAYYFFLNHTKSEEKKLKLQILKDNRKQALPLKLQAYERMALFLERINPGNLMIRVGSVNNDANAYLGSLLTTIDHEFEHNMAQQIYVSDECWQLIVASKSATVHLLTTTLAQNRDNTAESFRELVLQQLIKKPAPSVTALSFLKKELKTIL